MASAKAGALAPEKKIELFSGTYFGACTLGGIIGTPNSPLTIDSSTH